MMRTLCLLMLTIIPLSVNAAHGGSKEIAPTTYRLGIFPYLAARQIVELLGPLATKMQDELKHELKLESATSFSEFNNEIKNKKYDIALIQPFDYHNVVNNYGYLPLAQFDAQLVSQFIVRDDSRYRTLEDLKGTTLGLPPEESAIARMTLRTLSEKNIIPGRDIQLQHFKSHDSCLLQMWVNEISACGTTNPPVIVFEQRMQAKLRSVFDTTPIPHALFVVHPRVTAGDKDKLKQFLLGMNRTEEGRALLKTMGFPGFTLPRPAEYLILQNFASRNSLPATSRATKNDLAMGVFPYLTPRKLSENFAPAIHALIQSTGKNISFHSSTSFSSFSTDLRKASNDIVLIQPFEYKNATDFGYLPLAGMKDYLQSKFFVLDASPYRKIADFKGQVIAMPPSEAAMSRIARHTLSKNGLKPERDYHVRYAINHEACIQMVLNNEAVACATSGQAILMLSREQTQNLRVAGVTDKIPGVVFMAHKRLSKKLRLQLQETILSWNDSENGRKISAALHFGDFVKVNTDEYLTLQKFE